MQISISIEPYLVFDILKITQYLDFIVSKQTEIPGLSLHFDYFIDRPEVLKLVNQYADKIPTYAHVMHQDATGQNNFKVVSRDVLELTPANTKQTNGIVLDLGCDWEQYRDLIKEYPYITIMAVKCGKSGQVFHPDVLSLVPKIREINPQAIITIDGGVNQNNIEMIKNASIDIAVVGTYAKNAYESGNFTQSINRLLHD